MSFRAVSGRSHADPLFKGASEMTLINKSAQQGRFGDSNSIPQELFAMANSPRFLVSMRFATDCTNDRSSAVGELPASSASLEGL